MEANHAIDLGPLLSVLATLALAALGAAGTWLAARVASWLKLNEDSQVRGYLEAALDNAVTYGRNVADARLKDGLAINVHSTVVAEAANYAIARVPDALKRFGLDEAGVRSLILARLPSAPLR